MEKPYDKEYIKMAMLKHEETFKQQVYELHRLYRIQKLLMKSIENGSPKSRETHERWDYRSGIIKSNQINDQHHQDKPAKEHIAESYGEIALEIEDESEIQLTLGPTSYYRRKKFAETPRASDSGSSLSSSSTGSSNQEFLEIGRKKSFDVEEQLRQDHKVKQVFQTFKSEYDLKINLQCKYEED